MAGILAVGSGLGASSASAQGYGYGYGGGYSTGYVTQGCGYSGGGYAPSYGYGGGGYAAPTYAAAPTYTYYGNGGHDAQPHLHIRQGLFGTRTYYGLGAHDFRPHAHVESPYGITSYSNGRFSNTQSYAAPSPYIYQPW